MKPSNGTDQKNETSVNVIKRVSGGAARSGVIKNQAIAATQVAEDILARARSEADSIINDAAIKAEQVLDEAYRKGIERSLAEFEKHLIEIREIRANVMRDTEQDLVTLAVRIAEKILGKELTLDKSAITEIVTTALRNARQRDVVTVFVNPTDLKTVTKERERYSSDERIRLLDFVADPAVPAGGCVIETEVGKIDARLETQFKVIESALLSQVDNNGTI